jgi:hypothetical protein
MSGGNIEIYYPSVEAGTKNSVMAHELQHAIQGIEGWGRGGNEFMIRRNPLDYTSNETIEYAKSLPRYQEMDNDADRKAFIESFAKMRLGSPFEAYRKLTGEAQARATQDRLDMDMVQRRENYPLAGGKLSDIPLKDLIYKYEGNGPSLSMDPLSKYKDYVGEHSAPLGDSGAPLHDLTANENAIYPSDVYSSQANQYYGSGEPEDAQLFAMAQRLKDKPNEKVSIYRAVPKMQSNSEKIAGLEKDLANYMKRGRMPKNADFDNKSDWYEWASNERDRLASLPEETIEPLSINHGDWVALDKKYAKEHGESALGGNYKILSKKVPARQLFTNGDSIREWGWDSRYAQGGSVDKDSLQLDKPQRTPNHPTKSHIVKTMVDGKENIIRFGEQGAQTAGKPKEGESDRMTAKRESFKARHAKNIAKGKSSAAYWANKVKWAEGGEVDLSDDSIMSKLYELQEKYEESDYGYGNRPDKTKKGLGYFGELERPDGTGVMTEYSIGVPINGKEMDVPTLVPTLTPDEIRLILHLQEGEDMPRSIVHKAIDHAHQRLSEGKPIFATEEDLYAHGGIVDVLHNDAIEQIMKAFMDSMEDEQEEEEPAAVSIQITTHSQPLKSGKIPTSIREAKHG